LSARFHPLGAALAFTALAVGVLLLPPTTSGPASEVGLGTALGAGARLLDGSAQRAAVAAVMLLAVGGPVIFTASLVSQRAAELAVPGLVAVVATPAVAAWAMLGSNAGPAVVLAAIGFPALVMCDTLAARRLKRQVASSQDEGRTVGGPA
jgi:hypothetical protein